MKKNRIKKGQKYVFAGLKGKGKETEPEWMKEVVAEDNGESAMISMPISK